MVRSWLVQCPLLSRNVVGVTLALTLTIIIHVACLSDHDYSTPMNTSRSDPHNSYHTSAINKRCLAGPLESLYRYEDSCNFLPRSLSHIAPGTNVRYHRECHSHFTRTLDRLGQPSLCCLSHSWICEVFHKEGPELEWLFFHQFVYIMWEGWAMGSVTGATECNKEFTP